MANESFCYFKMGHSGISNPFHFVFRQPLPADCVLFFVCRQGCHLDPACGRQGLWGELFLNTKLDLRIRDLASLNLTVSRLG